MQENLYHERDTKVIKANPDMEENLYHEIEHNKYYDGKLTITKRVLPTICGSLLAW